MLRKSLIAFIVVPFLMAGLAMAGQGSKTGAPKEAAKSQPAAAGATHTKHHRHHRKHHHHKK